MTHIDAQLDELVGAHESHVERGVDCVDDCVELGPIVLDAREAHVDVHALRLTQPIGHNHGEVEAERAALVVERLDQVERAVVVGHVKVSVGVALVEQAEVIEPSSLLLAPSLSTSLSVLDEAPVATGALEKRDLAPIW